MDFYSSRFFKIKTHNMFSIIKLCYDDNVNFYVFPTFVYHSCLYCGTMSVMWFNVGFRYTFFIKESEPLDGFNEFLKELNDENTNNPPSNVAK